VATRGKRASERKRTSETPRVATAALSMYVSLMSQGRLAGTGRLTCTSRGVSAARSLPVVPHGGGARGNAGQASERAKRESESPRFVTAALPPILLGVSQLQDRRLRSPAAPWCPCCNALDGLRPWDSVDRFPVVGATWPARPITASRMSSCRAACCQRGAALRRVQVPAAGLPRAFHDKNFSRSKLM